jgi:DNA polymerase III subunit delta'
VTLASSAAAAAAQRVRSRLLLTTVRDSLDRAFVDLVAFYRDVLTLQLGADVALVNVDASSDIERLARTSSPESTLRRVDAVLAARTAIDGNVAPLLAVEAMTLALRAG